MLLMEKHPLATLLSSAVKEVSGKVTVVKNFISSHFPRCLLE